MSTTNFGASKSILSTIFILSEIADFRLPVELIDSLILILSETSTFRGASFA